MDNTEYIDEYFKGNNSAEQKMQFEQKILNDASFAGEVAFYLSANGMLKQQLLEEKEQRFREIYRQQKVVPLKTPARNIWRYMAAAGVAIAVAALWLLSGENKSPRQLADTYVQKNWQTMPVTMGTGDSMQSGLTLYNSGRFAEALAIFEKLVEKDSTDDQAKKYAGIVSFRLKNYDKALNYFSLLASDTALYSNPGTLYKALTLLERDEKGDEEEARRLLQQVIEKKLEGKSDAEIWLKKLQ